MGSKGKKKGTKANNESSDVLQAVILSDTYQQRFLPLTLEKPRCLLPLNNIPLIEYTLEFLSYAGVTEVYVMCCSHADQIQEYIENSKWVTAGSNNSNNNNNSKGSPFKKIETILRPKSSSVGEAMRELDAKNFITTDFILVTGDIVSNISLENILNEHRQRRNKESNAIMTMVVRKSSSIHRTRARAEASVFAIDKKTNRLAFYQELKDDSKSISLVPEVFNPTTGSVPVEELLILNDLIDCHVDICSPEVPALFTENFDYEFMRRDFVRGILTSDLLGKTIYLHIVNNEYAARVRSLQTYDAVSKDIIGRWAYPICPDSNLLEDTFYKYQRGNIYKEEQIPTSIGSSSEKNSFNTGVVLARSSIIGNSTVIGSNTIIGDKTFISASTLGRSCNIGSNVEISNSYIWSNVKIGDNCIIKNSVIASNVIIGNNCIIIDGTIISFGVHIQNDKQFSGQSVVSKNVNPNNVPLKVINDSYYIFENTEIDEEVESDYEDIVQNSGLMYSLEAMNLSDDSFVDFERNETQTQQNKHKTRRQSVTSINTVNSEDDDGFLKEAQLGLERSLAENHDIDVAILELNTLRMAMNASYTEVRTATVSFLVNSISNLIVSNSKSPKVAVEKITERYIPMLKRQTFDETDEIELLQIAQTESSKLNMNSNPSKILVFFIDTLYDSEVTSEQAILEWWSSQDGLDAGTRSVTGEVKKFVEWLKNAEEDDEEDEEEDEDDE